MIRNMYSRDGFSMLAACMRCGRVNYVEQHGITASCKCSSVVPHVPIPEKYRFGLSNQYHGPARIPLKDLREAIALRELSVALDSEAQKRVGEGAPRHHQK